MLFVGYFIVYCEFPFYWVDFQFSYQISILFRRAGSKISARYDPCQIFEGLLFRRWSIFRTLLYSISVRRPIAFYVRYSSKSNLYSMPWASSTNPDFTEHLVQGLLMLLETLDIDVRLPESHFIWRYNLISQSIILPSRTIGHHQNISITIQKFTLNSIPFKFTHMWKKIMRYLTA
jgi:hypothetical protein